jgi:sec-independent protein translocase protein TatB
MGTPQTIQIASLGMADSLILMVLALVVFGPRRLPQIGRQIGKLMYEFRKASNDFKFQMEEELRNAEEADRRKKEEERLKALALAAPTPESPASETQAAEAEAAPATEPAASPYPWESVYPPIPTPVVETQPEVSATQTEPAQTELVLQAPSTGETVVAAPPKRTRRKKAAPPAAVTETAVAAESVTTHVLEAENMPPVKQAAAAIEEAPATEQAPHG